MILILTVVINDTVVACGGIDDLVGDQYIFGFVCFLFIKFGEILIIVSLIVKIIPHKLHGHTAVTDEADGSFAVCLCAVHAVGTDHVTESGSAVCGIHKIIKIITGGIDGGNVSRDQLPYFGFIRIHGIKAAVVVGVGEIYFPVKLAEKTVII